jgi:hypothetical protein
VGLNQRRLQSEEAGEINRHQDGDVLCAVHEKEMPLIISKVQAGGVVSVHM